MKNLIRCFLLIFNISFVRLTHFYGGTVTWKPLNNTDSSSTISVMFTQSYHWRQSYMYTNCNSSYILNQSPLIPTSFGTLLCVTIPSSLCGGYSTIPASGYCTDFSTLIDSSSSQMSTVQNITSGSKFCVAYTGTAWVVLQTTNCGPTTVSPTTVGTCSTSAAAWSIGCCVDLSIRLGGFINTPPVATIMSPIKVPINTLTDITIPVIDADNDIVRCRWAQNTAGLDECGGVCGVIPGSLLDNNNCLLTFNSTGKVVGDNYAVALMIEDFYTQSTYTPFSSIPLQFLIQIVATPICPLKPTISSDLSTCTAIEVGIQFNITILITQGCSGTTIEDFLRMPPLNMYKSGITQIGTSHVWTITETWTPTSGQLGSQVYCAVAIDSANITSDQYCKTFTVVPFGQTLYCPTDFSSNSTSVTANTSSFLSIIASTLPAPSTDNSQINSLSLGLALGLGIPLLLLLCCLAFYSCCCENCQFVSAKCLRRFLKRSRTVQEQNPLPDYREQYINNNQDSLGNYQLTSSNEKQRFSHENSIISMPMSDFELNYINITRTSFFSPSICSLPTEDVQYTTDFRSSSTHSMYHDSILIRAYSLQESQKTPRPSDLF